MIRSTTSQASISATWWEWTLFGCAAWSPLAVLLFLGRKWTGRVPPLFGAEALLLAGGLLGMLAAARLLLAASTPRWTAPQGARRRHAKRSTAAGLVVTLIALLVPPAFHRELALPWLLVLAILPVAWELALRPVRISGAGRAARVARNWTARLPATLARVLAAAGAPLRGKGAAVEDTARLASPAGTTQASSQAGGSLIEDDADPEEDLEAGEEFAPEVFQHSERRRTESGGEVQSGWYRVPFAAGEKARYLHVAFCPPLSTAPQLRVEPIEGPPVEIREQRAFTYGARIALRMRPPLPEPSEVILLVEAESPPARPQENLSLRIPARPATPSQEE